MNTREYEWADVTVIIGGRDITGVRGIKYMEKIEREAVYAKGRKPKSIQSGNISYEGEITVLQTELDALSEAGGGTILSLNVDCEFNYGNPSAGDELKTDRMEGIRFTQSEKELKQGDKFMEVTIPFVAIDLINNV